MCMHIKLCLVKTLLFNQRPDSEMFVLFFVNRKMHSGMKTYGCELCGKSFLDSLRLRMHLLSHSGKEIRQKKQPRSAIAVAGFTVDCRE